MRIYVYIYKNNYDDNIVYLKVRSMAMRRMCYTACRAVTLLERPYDEFSVCADSSLAISIITNDSKWQYAIRQKSNGVEHNGCVLCIYVVSFFSPLIAFFYIASSNQSIFTYISIVFLPLLRSVLKTLLIRGFSWKSLCCRARSRRCLLIGADVSRESVSLLFFFQSFFRVFFSYVRSARKRHFRDCALLVARNATRETNGTHTCSRARARRNSQ